MVTMSDRIRKSRVTAGLSQTQLAIETGVCRSAVAQWEREGGTCPSVQNLARIAVVTQVHFEWLATGRGPGRPQDGELPAPTPRAETQRDEREERILALLRRMPPRKRQVAHAIIEMLDS